MKKPLYILSLILLICFSLFCPSCTNSSPSQPSSSLDAKPKVLCTISMISDLVTAIGQDRVEVITLIKEELDPHSYELVKGDDEKLKAANLILFNGLGLEHGPLICRQLASHPNCAAIGDYIQKNNPEVILITDNQIDPHIWMDVSIWSQGIPLIVEKLSSLSPEDASFFAQNGKALKTQMDQIHQEILSLMKEIPDDKRYLVTCHDAFFYFAKCYLSSDQERGSNNWRDRFIAPEGLAPDSQLSTNDIKRVLQYIEKYQVKIVFPEYNVNQDSMYKILEASKKLGLNVRLAKEPLYGDTMSKRSQKNESYLDFIYHNAQIINQQLKGES